MMGFGGEKMAVIAGETMDQNPVCKFCSVNMTT